MLKKIMFIFIVLFVCNTAYASEMISKDIPIDTNQFIRISTRGGTWKLDYRCLPVFSFEISESKQGLLQEGKTIYFASDSAFRLEQPNAVTCQNANMDLQMETIQTANKNIYAMQLHAIEHQKKLPITIQFTLSPYIDRVSAKKNIDVFFPLELITGSEYSDNIFLKNENEIILLNDKFFNVTQVATNNTNNTTTNNNNNNLMQPIEIQLGQKYFKINEKQIPISAPAYMNENKVIMIPLRDLADNLGDAVTVHYDEQKRTIVVSKGIQKIVLPLNEDNFYIQDIAIPYLTPMVVTNGTTFLSLEDVIYILSIPSSSMVYNEDTQTIFLNKIPQ